MFAEVKDIIKRTIEKRCKSHTFSKALAKKGFMAFEYIPHVLSIKASAIVGKEHF